MKVTRGLALVGVALLALVNYSHAQQTISGKILDNKNRNEALIGATVVGIPNAMGTVSDEEGMFELSLPDSINKIVVSMTGYRHDTVLLQANKQTYVVYLSKEKSLKEVVFTQRRKGTEIGLLDPRKVENIGQRELMKAACCNLSESFETTPSIDIAYTDAITGYKQIQMLGLTGAHTLITRENIPDVRGLSAITGLTFTPGAWIESMQLSKGTGSVVNGFEGLAGQLNVEWRKTFSDERWHFNLYQNSQGRTEGNIIGSHIINQGVSTNAFIHVRSQWMQVDQNKDNYLDQPLENQMVLANRWFIILPKNYEIQLGAKGVLSKGNGGQIIPSHDSVSHSIGAWQFRNETNRIELFGKLGKILNNQPWKSIGWLNAAVLHEGSFVYGLRLYNAKHKNFYSNLIYQSIIVNTNHVIKAGGGVLYDHVHEDILNLTLHRRELTYGVFTEYAYNHLDKFNLVAGIRGDYNNLFGAFITPRLHLRYSPWMKSALRFSVGRAQRTPNALAENIGLLASARQLIVVSDYPAIQRLKPEVAWNYGGNFTQKFKLNYREGTVTADYYYTRFSNQLIVDIEDAHKAIFKSLTTPSSVHSFQLQLDYEPVKRLDVRVAYRFYDAKVLYQNGWQERPLMANHRTFINVGYETKSKWKFDATVNFIGSKRVPARVEHGAHHSQGHSPAFTLLNAQISKVLKKTFEVYLGGENLTNYMQHNLVLNGDHPYQQGFDASLVWGPAMGRNIYAGLRYTINKKKKA